jgi:hypothetical protein
MRKVNRTIGSLLREHWYKARLCVLECLAILLGLPTRQALAERLWKKFREVAGEGIADILPQTTLDGTPLPPCNEQIELTVAELVRQAREEDEKRRGQPQVGPIRFLGDLIWQLQREYPYLEITKVVRSTRNVVDGRYTHPEIPPAEPQDPVVPEPPDPSVPPDQWTVIETLRKRYPGLSFSIGKAREEVSCG